MTSSPEAGTCPRCGAPRLPDASFCEECAYDFQGAPAEPAHHTIRAAATPDTAAAGEESPLDTGWTGRPTAPPGASSPGGHLGTPDGTEPEGGVHP